jgi:hypothetical protein
MEQLGHSQISLTMNTYARMAPELLRDTASKLDEAPSGCAFAAAVRRLAANRRTSYASEAKTGLGSPISRLNAGSRRGIRTPDQELMRSAGDDSTAPRECSVAFVAVRERAPARRVSSLSGEC